MKLSKTNLIKLLAIPLAHDGYHSFKDSISGAEGLFGKKVTQDLYLMAGMTIHRYYDNIFTADLYLGRTTTIYCNWGDIPKDSIRRVYATHCISDNPEWWSADGQQEDFLFALHTLERQLCADTDLKERIMTSKDVAALRNIADSIKQNIDNVPDEEYSYIPRKPVDDIPMKWFMATEWTLKQMHEKLTPRIVKFHASDAYRQNVLDMLGAQGSTLKAF